MERLKTHWRNHGVTPNHGLPVHEIRAFEVKHGLKLPPDLEQYFLELNGIDVAAPPLESSPYRFADKDDDGFTFWPLERVTRASEGEAPQAFVNAEDYFVLADYLDWSWAYAIRLSASPERENPVVIIGTRDGNPQSLASSFNGFVELYLRGYEHIWIR